MNQRDIDSIKEKIIPILKRHRARKAGLFGSCVSGDIAEANDIDILIEIDEDIGLLEYVGIKLELEDALGKKVDLVEYSSIKPRLKERILNQHVAIL